MKAQRLLIVTVLMAFCDATPTGKSKSPSAINTVRTPACGFELSLAQNFASVGDWKDAESHFTAAVQDSNCQAEALAGIQNAKSNEATNLLETGMIYESKSQWAKAEEVYRAVANDSSTEVIRQAGRDRLAAVVEAEVEEKKWSALRNSISEWIKAIAEFVAVSLAMILGFFTILSIFKSRRRILIYPFSAPTDELAKGLGIQLRYARLTMNNPAFSRAVQIPPFLVENLEFSDDVEPIEDLEIGGGKIPFASLGKLFGRSRVRVTGGFDGVGPTGNAYSIIETQDGEGDTFVRREIRIGVPNEQRLDLLDFAYDVMVKASAAYVDI